VLRALSGPEHLGGRPAMRVSARLRERFHRTARF
jgi:hypothetical protein